VIGGELEDDDVFAAVLAGLQRGDDRAAEAVFSALHHRLLRYFRARGHRAPDDLAAEVWEAVAAAIGTFSGTWPWFRAWVFVIAHRRSVEDARRGARRRTDPHDDTAFAELVASEQPEDDVVEQDATSRAIALLARHLPEDQAEVVLLRVVAGLDAADVATAMGRTENWVRVTQHRALRKLADRIGSKEGVTR
jgi:RNA polymerase sigma-70 factor (ECF subfamily)